MTRGAGYGKIPGLELLSITNERGEFALKIPAEATSLDVRVRTRGFAPEIARNFLPATEGQVARVDVGASIAGRLLRDGKPAGVVRVGFDHKDRQGALGADKRGKLVKAGADGTAVELGDIELK